MKRMLSLLLMAAMLISVLSGCGGDGEQPARAQRTETEAAAAETTAAPTPEPATAPTVSQEELLYNSLPDRMKQAVDVGIVELSQMENLDRTVTIAEAAQMLQKAYTHRQGEESNLLADVLALECANEAAYLGWIGRLPIALYVEALEKESYQDYEQWMEHLVQYTITGQMPIITNDVRFYREGETVTASGLYDWFDIGWSSGMKNYFYKDVTGNMLLESCAGQGGLLAYTMLLRDQSTGHPILDNGVYNTLPVERIMTVETMAEMALRMYHAFYEAGELVPYEDCITADGSILTEELCSRETNLPDASCNLLPSSWHGVTLSELSVYESDGLTVMYDRGVDAEICEYEIQAIKDAGFNYIGLQINFSWFQGSDQFRTNPLDGNLDLTRLKKLDQILAWCMERDIHLDLRATGIGGYVLEKQKCLYSPEEFAKLWSVLAQRYAHIPNAYLSFCVIDQLPRNFDGGGTAAFHLDAELKWNGGPGSQKKMVDFIRPSVEAIRTASPERCILVDLSGDCAAGTDILELGVALSVDLIGSNGFFMIGRRDYLNPDYYLTMQWPYEGTGNAEALFDEKLSWMEDSTPRAVAALAQENGLGFMIGGWGEIPLCWTPAWGEPAYRYSDAAYQAFIEDVTNALKDYGYGWCYDVWYGTNGVTYSLPITKNVVYEQLGEYPLYYDTAMLGWFKEINGVA